MLNAVKAESYLTVTAFKQLRAGININIYAQKSRLKVYITAEKYMSWVRFHIVYRKSKRGELNEAQPYSKNINKWPNVVTTTPSKFIACWCGFTVLSVTTDVTLSLWGKQDSYQHQTHSRMNTMIWSRGEVLLRKEIMNSVYSPLRCVRSLRKKHDDIIPETRTEGSKRMGIDNDDGKMKKLQSQALKSLKKAAVAIFPLPHEI